MKYFTRVSKEIEPAQVVATSLKVEFAANVLYAVEPILELKEEPDTTTT